MGDTLQDKARKIKWILLDIDGVMTDGSITYDSKGVESKTFHVRDGHGIKMASRAGIQFAIITGRESSIVNYRANELGIKEIYQGAKKKIAAYNELIQRLNLQDEEVAYVGDDLIDIPVLRRVGLSAVVADADHETREQVDLILTHPGGRGAVREFIEIILKAQDKWKDVTQRYFD